MIPLHADDYSSFTPLCLKPWGDKAPRFELRPATPLDQRNFQLALRAEGLHGHSPELMRAEILKVVNQGWDAESAAPNLARLHATWDALDQGNELPDEELRAYISLLKEVEAISPEYRRMLADNIALENGVPRIALSFYLVSMTWQGMTHRFPRAANRVPDTALDQLESELERIDRQAIAEGVKTAAPGVTYMELAAQAMTMLRLSRGEEKNSASPFPWSSIPNGSTTLAETATSSKSRTARPSRAPKPKPSAKKTSN